MSTVCTMELSAHGRVCPPKFVRAAVWRMAGAYLVLEEGGSKQVWRR